LRVGVSPHRWPVEDESHAHYSGLHDHAGARLGHAGRTHFAFPSTGAGIERFSPWCMVFQRYASMLAMLASGSAACANENRSMRSLAKGGLPIPPYTLI